MAIFDTGIFDLNLFDNDMAFRITKVSNLEAVVRIIGQVTVSVSASQLITQTVKYGSIQSGSNILTLSPQSDNVGLLVGSSITDELGITSTITAIDKNIITLAAPMPITSADRTWLADTQIAGANSLLDISKIYFSTNSTITISRNSITEFILSGSDHWDLNNMMSKKSDNYPINVVMGSPQSVLILNLKKNGDWGNNNSSYGNI